MEPVFDKVVWLVAAAAVAYAVGVVARTPRRVKEARIAAVRTVNDWQMHREFLQRRREAELYQLTKTAPGDTVTEQHVRDRFDDEADALKLQLEREAADALRRLSSIDRLWWALSSMWDRTRDEEEELDWAARSVRGIFDDYDGD